VAMWFLLATAAADRFFVPALAPAPQTAPLQQANQPLAPAYMRGPAYARSPRARVAPVVALDIPTLDFLPDVTGWLPQVATVITVGFFLSPAPAAIKVWKKEAPLDAINFDSVLFIWLNCTCWLIYANLLPLPEAIAVNFGGWCCATAYLIVWFTCAADKRAEVQDKLKGGAVLLGTSAVLGGVRVDVLGYLVTLVNISMFGAPLLEIQTVLKEKSSKGLPLPTISTGLLCSSMWTVVGLQLGNLPLAAPNGIGAVLNLAQLGLIAAFPAGESSDADAGLELSDKQ